jgi:AcrR family transcriptional regulator
MVLFDNEKVDLRVKYTREWTYEALAKLLQIQTYHDITISSIIDKAGISRATFYRNFNNKDDIVRHKVALFFQEFHQDMLAVYQTTGVLDEQYLIQAFFDEVNDAEALIDVVIKTNMEYTMVDGILAIIRYHKDRFYELVKTNKKTEDYTMDIVASSCWTLLSRWHKSGKEETPSRLAKIYLGAFKSVYIALFDDRSKLA